MSTSLAKAKLWSLKDKHLGRPNPKLQVEAKTVIAQIKTKLKVKK
jgi:hypothetical protein